MSSGNYWNSLDDLFDLYGIDKSRGGGQMFFDLCLWTWALRGTGYTVRDFATAFRRESRISPLVHCSLMKRAAWQLLDASDSELAEMRLRPLHRNVYDLADAIADALKEQPTPVQEDMLNLMCRRMEELHVFPQQGGE